VILAAWVEAAVEEGATVLAVLGGRVDARVDHEAARRGRARERVAHAAADPRVHGLDARHVRLVGGVVLQQVLGHPDHDLRRSLPQPLRTARRCGVAWRALVLI
jgi:hypothetical protein